MSDERRVSVQREGHPRQGGSYVPPGTVSWEVHQKAWENYAAAGHGSQSAERLAERGGFGYRELQCALAGHYNLCCSGCVTEHPVPPTWMSR